uniref:helix-turn-helix domain-containing protein n=1 Tax=uncultured Erythrobacter sp. TaxID=263913 RepID=UPI00261548E8|nr:helix-turn-helix domain-containing protein [uncultured Erythrobacter sp.]
MDSEQDSGSDELTATPELALLGVGDRLRVAREEQGLELSHIAAETRIPERHLQSIEAGSFDDLPSRTYAIGFARTYARVVGLDEKDIADAVREELAEGQGRQSALAGGMEPGDPGKLPSSGLAWFGALAAVILAVGIYAFYSTYFGAGDGLESLIAQNEDEEAAAAEIAAADASDNSEAGASAIAASGKVVFTAQDDMWVRFYDANYEETREPLFEGTMSSGDMYELPQDANQPRINTGRPDALAITIGGQGVPRLAEEPIAIGDAEISAEALLARTSTVDAASTAVNPAAN